MTITTMMTSLVNVITTITIYTSLLTILLIIIPAVLLQLIPSLSVPSLSPSSSLSQSASKMQNASATTTSTQTPPHSSSPYQTRSKTIQQQQRPSYGLPQTQSQQQPHSPFPLQSSLSFYLRCLIAVVALFASTCYGATAALLLRLVGLHGLSQWMAGRCYKWLMWVFAGVGFEVVEGREHLRERPAVFMGNHQTELDVLLLGCIFPRFCSVTAKSSLKHVPFLGWFMSLSNTVFIDRANRTTALAAFDSAATQMRAQRQSVFIFPEGTRSYAEHPSLLPFKKGGFHLAIKAQVPVVAIVCGCYSGTAGVQLVSFGSGNESAGKDGKSPGKAAGNDTKRKGGKRFGSGVVPVSVLPPFPTKGLTSADVDDLIMRVREAMLAELIRLSSDAAASRDR